MSACVDLVSNALVLSVNQTQPCANFTLLTGREFTSLPTLADVFAIPLATDLQTMWYLGFALPVVAYMTAWAYQSLISFIEDKQD